MVRHNGIELVPDARTIRHRGREWRSHRENSQVYRAIEALILGGELSLPQLFWIVFGHDPEGGPNEGPHIFCIRFGQWRPIFKQLDLEMRKTRIASVTFYQLVPVHRF